MLKATATDRRMARSTVDIGGGGIAAAIARYRNEASPDLLIIESSLETLALRQALGTLAENCLPHTRLLLAGPVNDIRHYRSVIACGASEYLALPADSAVTLEIIESLYADRPDETFATTVAFVGAKGGAGASSIALAIASTLSSQCGSQVILADLDATAGGLDIAAGIAGGQTIADVLKESPRLDAMLLDRVLSPVRPNLSLLPPPPTSPTSDRLADEAVVRMIEVARSSAGFVLLDLPGTRASDMKTVLQLVDKVVLVAEPDLVSLRNVSNWHTWICQLRGNADTLQVVLNKVGMPKRLEILPRQFEDALPGCSLLAIPFDASLLDAYAGTNDLVHQKALSRRAKRGLAQVADMVAGRYGDAGRGRSWLPWRRG
jgi:pilus assembly protein CpaE